jgi:3',5'-nucleoside bisphosphate phosphatase
MPADLHTHSSASDGVDTPAEVMAVAAAAGLSVVALTDHDTTAGWEQASAAAGALGLTLVPGVEISCRVGVISVHLLSYLHDPAEPRLRRVMERTRNDRVSRARRMVRRLSTDVDITWQDVLAQVHGDATIGRPHLADALIARGVVRTRDEAFAGLLHRDSPYYVPHYAPQAADAVRLVRRAGGVPVMAHPLASSRGRVVSAETIAALADAGMLGLEADHPDHTPAQRDRLRALAGDLGLFWTGSSDYHGAARPQPIGACTTPPAAVEAILAAGTGTGTVR